MGTRTVVLAVALLGLLGGCATQAVERVPATTARIDHRIPPQFRLTHDGESGWTRSEDTSAPGIFRPCPDQPDPTLTGRVGAVTSTGPGVPLVPGTAPGVLHEQLLLFADDSAASAAMTAMVKAKTQCGWSETIVDWVAGYDSDVLVTNRFLGPPGPQGYVVPQQATGQQEAFVLHRGPALWLTFTEAQGGVPGVGFVAGSVDVRQELCTLMGLCYP